MEREKTLEFGRKYRVGNFLVLKFSKVLRKSEMAELRDNAGIPADVRKQLERARLPYIKVMASSGLWAVEFCCNTSMYRFIDTVLARALQAEDEGVSLDGNSVGDFHYMFSMFFTDTCIIGDGTYMADRARALMAYMDRQKADDVSEEEDARVLGEIESEEKAKADIIDMAERLREGGADGE